MPWHALLPAACTMSDAAIMLVRPSSWLPNCVLPSMTRHSRSSDSSAGPRPRSISAAHSACSTICAITRHILSDSSHFAALGSVSAAYAARSRDLKASPGWLRFGAGRSAGWDQVGAQAFQFSVK